MSGRFHFQTESNCTGTRSAVDFSLRRKIQGWVLGNKTNHKKTMASPRPAGGVSPSTRAIGAVGAPAVAEDVETELRLLVENSIDVLCRYAPDGALIYLSSACHGVLGFEPQALIGRNLRDLAHPNDLDRLPPVSWPGKTKRPTAAGPDAHFAEFRLRRRDGVYIWTQTSSRVIRGGDGRPREVIAAIRDITERRHADISARHAERLASIGTLAAGIAHEINNPLGAILMAAHAAREFNRTPGNEAQVEEMIAQIMTDARRGARIVANVLQFARRDGTQRGPADMREIAMRARRQGLRYADRRAVEIKVRGPDDAPWVLVSEAEIEQVLVNLLQNSIDAGAARIDLAVRLDRDDGRVTVSVTDNGRGMTGDELAHAFDPFFSAPAQGAGAGLGLSIAQGIVASHDGTIALTSEPMRGTTVAFDLPLTARPAEEVAGA